MSDSVAQPGPDLLATIVAATRHTVAERERRCSVAAIAAQAASATPRGARFVAALREPGGVRIIAECKRRSPSRGMLRADYRPDRIAAAYEAHGATAVSVVTEPTFFDGALDHLRAVRAAVDLPVLRKDFIVARYQLLEAVAAGADAVLLIAAVLDDAELGVLLRETTSLGLAALVEVHDGVELRRAVQAGAIVIGVNNRNLRTLAVDVNVSRTLVVEMPPGTVAVAESGLRTSDDLVDMGAAGFHAFLIGETLITTPEPGETLGRLIDGTRSGATGVGTTMPGADGGGS